MSRRLLVAGFVAACLGLLGRAAPGAEGEAAAQARDILAATGVKGGLVVHLGCGDGKLTAALRANDSFLVHGLDPDPANVEKARAHIRSLGLYGKVTAEVWVGERLPYVDNLANLIVASGECRVPGEEIQRVLTPNGVALIAGKNTVKPRPKEIDEWTHFLHDASNNAVANDALVGPPQHLQWVSGPRWARSHDQLSSTSAAVTSGGRLFAIIDEGPIAAVALPPAWMLVARDAFNGTLLWKRQVGPWENHLRGFRSGPPEISRRLVAIGDRVYVTLGYGKPVTALDAATGETLKTYEGTEGTREILWHDGALLLAVAEADAKHAAEPGKPVGTWLFWDEHEKAEPPKQLLALKADTGEALWKRSDAELGGLMPMTLAANGDKVLYQSTGAVVCLDGRSGRELWRTPRPTPLARPAWSAPTLVVHGGIVLSADRGRPAPSPKSKEEPAPKGLQRTVTSKGGMAPVGELIALSAQDGKPLWRSTCRECYNAPADLFVAGGKVWNGNLVIHNDPGVTAGLDPATGEAKLKREPDAKSFVVGMFHHRCYRNKATERYLLLGRAGVEFLDTATGQITPNHWVRGACQYGIVPANGLLYAPHHSCACYIQSKLTGFNALSATRSVPRPSGDRLERGPAYGALGSRQSAVGSEEWPTYRHDPARSGSTPSAVPAELKPAWEADLGGRLTPPVVADGRTFVASTDVHTVHCVQADDGNRLWSFTAGGRVDGPPTISDGLAIFGCADGSVYALRASDGALAWRFRAAPSDLRTVAYDQLESLWPVHGSVLVEDRAVSFAAGRSSFLDGGIRLSRLEARTGKLLAEKTLSSRDPKTGEEPQATIRGFDMPGALPDVLSSDGTSLFMRHVRLDRSLAEQPTGARHLFSSAGFVDDSWWHRTYWLLGAKMESGWSGWIVAGSQAPAGRILVFDAASVYGYGRDRYGLEGSHVGLGKTSHRLFACAREPKVLRAPADQPAAKTESDLDKGKAPKAKAKGQQAQPRIETRWTQPVPLLVRAMVLAEKTLFIGGPPDVAGGGDEAVAALAGSKGGLLWAVAAADGKKLAEHKLASPPVHDGLIAAAGRLYITTLDGKLHCFRGEAK